MTDETRLPTMEEFKAMVDRHDWYFPWGSDENHEAGRDSLNWITWAMGLLGSEAVSYYRAKNPLWGPKWARRAEDEGSGDRTCRHGMNSSKI